MKKLQKIRLINWHRFANETIMMDDSVLISGENGAGKSTLLDAIQLVITCSKNSFNNATHDNQGKRTLNTYVRCKTGREDKPYERSGSITSHIALEFYDEARRQPFIVGAVMDSASEEKEPNTAWYLIENQILSDELFMQGDMVKSISNFRATNRQIRIFAVTQKEARKMMASRFGRLEEKFFSLIPKALAFHPIHDIKDFVYNYVLDEKEVNIESLKENVRSYQDLEHMLQNVKQRIGELEQIIDKEKKVENCLRFDRQYEFYLTQAAADFICEKQQQVKDKKQHAVVKREEERRERRSLAEQRDRMLDTISDLKAELLGSEEYLALAELKRQETQLSGLLMEKQQEVKELMRHAKASGRMILKLTENGIDEECLYTCASLLQQLPGLEDLSLLRISLEQVMECKKRAVRRLEEKLAEQRMLQQGTHRELDDLRQRIKALEKRKLTYPAEVTMLQDAISAELRKAGREGEVRVLCEMLEITQPAWTNAVEGYLNTQRFYLLVRPEDFDLALSVYDRQREHKKVYGVGLINTGRLIEYDKAPEESLAAVVTSSDIWAKRYINMVLGKVVRAQSYQELKKYPAAVTRQCMRYQNHVVSAIRPEIYQTPFIGKEAYRQQLLRAREEAQLLEEKKKQIDDRIKMLTGLRTPLDVTEEIEIKYHISDLAEERRTAEKLAACREKISGLEKNSTLIEKQIYMEQLQESQKKLDQRVADQDQMLGRLEETIRYAEEEMEQLTAEITQRRQALSELEEKLGEEAENCKSEYQKVRSRRGRDLVKFISSYEITRRRNQRTRENEEQIMIGFMRKYKSDHGFGAAESMQGFPEFEMEYHKLKDSQLLAYEDKVQKAREAAEEEFREQFLSRLQENIKQAQGELRRLNSALQDIHFSSERYVFRFVPNRDLRKYYDMIMDDFNILQEQSIFSGIFQENHREVIEELFEKLAQSDEASEKILKEYTDYRTYMEYDIEIHNDDGSYMLYSKVSREKSGGETQTPFYITVAASFMQLYRGSIGGDAIGLVMFDEAFNNMDDERITGVLNFMTKADLQLIIAAPPEKIQYIAPAVKKVLLVLPDNQMSYVEDFTRK